MVETGITRTALAVMVAASTAAIVRVGVLPMQVPQPAAADPALEERLQALGWKPTATPPAKQGQKVSQAKGSVFNRQNGTAALELTLIPARVRGAGLLDAKTIAKSTLGRNSDGAKVVYRRRDALLITSPEQGKRSALTCIVPGGAATDSEALVKLRLRNDPRPTSLDRLKMLAGLEQPREWGCLFTEIRVNDSPSAQSQLLSAWDALRSTLRQSE